MQSELKRLNIGLTYDLRSEYLAAGYGEEETAEFDRDDTISSLETALQQLGPLPDRIGNARQLVSRLAAGDRWDLVLNICEGLRGFGREAQVPAILDTFEIPYTFADPLVMSVCLHKSITKTIVSAAGIPTPRSLLVEQLADLETCDLKYPLFIKPVAEGTGKGVTPLSKITDQKQLNAQCAELLRRYQQSVLVEEYLPGREFTVGLIGTGNSAKSLGTLEIVLLAGAEPNAYSYVNKEQCEELVESRLVHSHSDSTVAKAEAIALAAWRTLGCRDGGRIDLRCDAAGEPQFIEANPLAGLHPLHSDLPMLATAIGMPYHELIGQIVDSATLRIVSTPRVPSTALAR
jgi:D-alanine-D-alanine ligase